MCCIVWVMRKTKINQQLIDQIRAAIESGQSLAEIAPKVGYADHAALSRALKLAGLKIVKTLKRINN